MSLDPNWTLAAEGTPADELLDNEYLEAKDTGKEAYSANNSAANRIFLVNWSVRAAFIEDLCGYSFLHDNGLTQDINRIIPDSHPAISNFWASDCTVDPYGPASREEDTGAAHFTLAKITANYKPSTYEVKEDSEVDDGTELDRYTTRNFGAGIEYLTVQGNVKWVTRPQHEALAFQPGFAIGTQTLTYIWHEVPAISDDPFTPPNIVNITSCLGKVNSAIFDPTGGAYPPGTVLFVGVDPKMQTPKLTGDQFYWEITMSFVYKNYGAGVAGERAGWNYVYDPANQRWDLVTTDGTSTGGRIYQSADLNGLWEII